MAGPKAAATVAENNPLCNPEMKCTLAEEKITHKEEDTRSVLVPAIDHLLVLLQTISRYKVKIASEPSITPKFAWSCAMPELSRWGPGLWIHLDRSHQACHIPGDTRMHYLHRENDGTNRGGGGCK